MKPSTHLIFGTCFAWGAFYEGYHGKWLPCTVWTFMCLWDLYDWATLDYSSKDD